MKQLYVYHGATRVKNQHCKVRTLNFGMGFHNNAYEVYCGHKLPCETHGMQGANQVIYPTVNEYHMYGVTWVHEKDLEGLPHLKYLIMDGKKIFGRKKQ